MSKPLLTPLLILVLQCVPALFLAFGTARAAPPEAVVDTIGGHHIESLTMRHPDAKAVVVFEAGSRGTIASWGTVPASVARDATVFAWNRPGYGHSASSSAPRDGRTIVEELRQVLRQKGLKPPYVLVGHSLGGLYMQLFARAYPEEVRGLVLVDALYPRMIKKTGDFPLATRIAAQLAFSRSVWREIEQIDATGEAVLALGGIDDKPVIQLVNVPRGATAIPVDFGAFRMDAGTRDFVRGLYPHAKTVVVDSSHQMQLTNPEVIVKAVQDILKTVGLTVSPFNF